MKLYLSSYKLGNEAPELLGLLNGGKKVGVIMAAQDYKDIETRTARYLEECAALKKIGLEPEEIDLRDYFVKHEGLLEQLSKYDMLWVRGGNAFVLRKALAMSGADKIVVDLIQHEQVVYGGYSAGVCVLTPDLRGIELVDVENIYVPGYQSETIWEGLNLIPYAIAPHYKSDHYESAAIDDVVEYFKVHKTPYKTLSDGDVLVVDGDTTTLIHNA